jgi:hypothetical protein
VATEDADLARGLFTLDVQWQLASLGDGVGSHIDGPRHNVAQQLSEVPRALGLKSFYDRAGGPLDLPQLALGGEEERPAPGAWARSLVPQRRRRAEPGTGLLLSSAWQPTTSPAWMVTLAESMVAIAETGALWLADL